MDLQRHRLEIVYLDNEGKRVEEKFTPKTLDHYEFIGQGQILFIQNVGNTKAEILKDNEVILNRKYIPVKNIISLKVDTLIQFSNKEEKVEFVKRML